MNRITPFLPATNGHTRDAIVSPRIEGLPVIYEDHEKVAGLVSKVTGKAKIVKWKGRHVVPASAGVYNGRPYVVVFETTSKRGYNNPTHKDGLSEGRIVRYRMKDLVMTAPSAILAIA